MMLRKKAVWIIVASCVGVALAVSFVQKKVHTSGAVQLQKIRPTVQTIRQTIATTGIIQPQNRLEIKPSINGRTEEILVREGDEVKKGDILAWMSSTERAALVDTADLQGDEREYWENVYKKTPIISPIDGEVIVRSVEPGQTIATSDVVLVISDRLIVCAQFDETDIGKVKKGQSADISLDAYPDKHVFGVVDHIAFESEIVNNVTIYDVDIVAEKMPPFFRSGMSTNVELIQKEKVNGITVPIEAVSYDEKGPFVLCADTDGNGTVKRHVTVGVSDSTHIEIVDGVGADEYVYVQRDDYQLVGKKANGNPFMPSRRKR